MFSFILDPLDACDLAPQPGLNPHPALEGEILTTDHQEVPESKESCSQELSSCLIYALPLACSLPGSCLHLCSDQPWNPPATPAPITSRPARGSTDHLPRPRGAQARPVPAASALYFQEKTWLVACYLFINRRLAAALCFTFDLHNQILLTPPPRPPYF